MSEYRSKSSEQSENLVSLSIVENVHDLEVASPYVAEVPQTLTKQSTGTINNVETDMEMNGPIAEKRSSFKEAQGSKIQLTWNKISIFSQKKKRICSRNDQCANTIKILARYRERVTIENVTQLFLKKCDEHILLFDINNISGSVLQGQILTIIGASGAGKTTLLNYLSGRDPSGNLEKHGEVYVNRKDRNKFDFSGISAYVQQDDVLFLTMTVRECIDFAAKMKLPTTNYQMIVDDLIESLGLQRASNTRIGGSLVRGVSGGERKRTSIGVELITNPNFIFLDEPTTGLDSYTAQNVFRLLKELATSGRTVVLTIHQPSSEIFLDVCSAYANGLRKSYLYELCL